MTSALLEPDTAPRPMPVSAYARDGALTAARCGACCAGGVAVAGAGERAARRGRGRVRGRERACRRLGDDLELCGDVSTVDDELASLQAERRALVEVTVDLVRVGRSLDAAVRVVADQHARVVSRFDTLDADQLERRLSSPATALAGEFACDDYAPILDISPATAARWAETGSTLRARHPHLLALAGEGRVRIRACDVIASELDHLDTDQAAHIEAELLTGDVLHGTEASICKQVRRVLDHHGLARPRVPDDDASRIGLGFSDVPEQPFLTELNVTMCADDAWQLHAAIEQRAHALVDEWAQVHGPQDAGYPLQRARVDALVDLALGNVRFVPDVRISVPPTLTPHPSPPTSWPPPWPPRSLRQPPWQPSDACPQADRLQPVTNATTTMNGVGRANAITHAAGTDVSWAAARPGSATETPCTPAPADAQTASAHAVVPASAATTTHAAADAETATPAQGESAPATPSMGTLASSITGAGALAPRAAACVVGNGMPTAGAREGWSVADVDVPHIGRISGGAIRALAGTLGASVTLALTHPDTGVTAWTAARTYRPGLGMRRHVEARDEHCRFPGCMRPAPMCDVDHVTPRAHGGPTSPSNLQLLCRHHHRAKTHGGWAASMTPTGTTIWQSPTGHWFRTHPSDATAHRTTATDALNLMA